MIGWRSSIAPNQERRTVGKSDPAGARRAGGTVFLAGALTDLGVRFGDRVAGYLPNRTETLVAFLATASLGAIWSNCPPELSSKGVLERLTQIEPKVLIAVAVYQYGGKQHDRRMALVEIAAGLPTLREMIVIPQAPDEKTLHFDRAGFKCPAGRILLAPGRSGRNTLFPAGAFRSSSLDLVLFRNNGRPEADHARTWRHSAGTPQGALPASGSPDRETDSSGSQRPAG